MLVSDVMTRPGTCPPGTQLTDVARSLADRFDDTLPVVASGEAPVPVGLIVGSAFIHRLVLDEPALEQTAADVMDGLPATVTAETPAEDALALLDRHAVPYLIVVDGDGRYSGVVGAATIRKLLQSP